MIEADENYRKLKRKFSWESFLYNSHINMGKVMGSVYGELDQDSYQFKFLRQKCMDWVKNHQVQVLRMTEVPCFFLVFWPLCCSAHPPYTNFYVESRSRGARAQ